MNRRSFCARLLALFGFAGAGIAVQEKSPVVMGMDLAAGDDSTSVFSMDENGVYEFRTSWIELTEKLEP